MKIPQIGKLAIHITNRQCCNIVIVIGAVVDSMLVDNREIAFPADDKVGLEVERDLLFGYVAGER
jgi:hypothetical protein